MFDVPALTGLMRDLASRKVRLVEVETQALSPFGKSLLFRYVGVFMYEGDSPLAERRAQALALDSSLLAELLGGADLRELLDPEVVEQTQNELQRLAPGRACRDLEAVADLLRTIGPLSAAEVADRCTEPGAAPSWLAELAAQRRVIEVRISGEARWAAIEDAGRLRDALGRAAAGRRARRVHRAGARPAGRPGGPVRALPWPVHHRRRGGPLRPRAGGRHRRATAAGGAGPGQRGEFRPGAGARNGATPRCCGCCGAAAWPGSARRPSRSRRRSLARSCPPGRTQVSGPGAATGSGRAGSPRAARPDAVYDAVEQLAGAPVPALRARETLTLPGRVPGYQGALLDELTAAGEIVWSGAGGLPGGDGWLVLAPAHTAPLLLPPPSEITMTPLHEAVLAALDGGGGMFFRMIADRAAGLLPEAERRGFTDTAVAAAIWDLVWAGRLTNDTLAPLRTVLGTGRPVADAGRPAARPGGPDGPVGSGAPAGPGPNGLGRPNGLARPDGLGRTGGGLARPGGLGDPGWVPLPSRPGRSGRFGTRRPGAGRMGMASRTGPPTVTGRWSLLPEPDPDPTRRLHALARTLLERHGILTKGAVTAERTAGGFGALYPVLRAMEEAGHCRRGYFVEGLGGAQFALPGAVDRMRAMAADAASPAPAQPPQFPESQPRWPGAPGEAWHGEAKEPPGPTVTVLAAADPANPFGASLAWPARPGEVPGGHRPGRKAGALVVLSGGQLVLYVERGGKTLLSWTSDPAVLAPAAAGLAEAVRGGALGRLTVERADGSGVYESPLAQALAGAGFRPTPRGLRLRG